MLDRVPRTGLQRPVTAADAEDVAARGRVGEQVVEILPLPEADDLRLGQQLLDASDDARAVTSSCSRVDDADDARAARVGRHVDRQRRRRRHLCRRGGRLHARPERRDGRADRPADGDVARVVGARRDAGERDESRERLHDDAGRGRFRRHTHGEGGGARAVAGGEGVRRRQPEDAPSQRNALDRGAQAWREPLADLVRQEAREGDVAEPALGGPLEPTVAGRGEPGAHRHPQHRVVGGAAQLRHDAVEHGAAVLGDRREQRTVETVDVTHDAHDLRGEAGSGQTHDGSSSLESSVGMSTLPP